MLTSAELFHRFYKYIERCEFELDNPNFRKEYASFGLGLEMGYYSLSKTDLFVAGTKRGRLIKKPGKHFCGYEYCFLGDRLQIAKCLDGKDRNITFTINPVKYTNIIGSVQRAFFVLMILTWNSAD